MVKTIEKESQKEAKKESSGKTFSEFTWEDGGKYEGEWLNGKFNPNSFNFPTSKF